MQIELDDLFVCTAVGAPETETLVQFGLNEGPPNQHPGQGIACRRIPFANAMIELLWVSEPREAQSESTRRTLLWGRGGLVGKGERLSFLGSPACGSVVLKSTGAPFPAWEYRPADLPDPLSIHVSEAGIEEPMWLHLSFM